MTIMGKPRKTIDDFFKIDDGSTDPYQSGRLASFMFQDVYLSTMEDKTLIRGLRPKPPEAGNRAMIEAPSELRRDIKHLFDLVMETYEANGQHPEFSVKYDGITYRCSLIDVPNDSHPAADKINGHLKRWHLRRLAIGAPDLGSLGYPNWMTSELDKLSEERGMLLIAGTFSSGKTTAAASTLKHWIEKHGDIAVTFEDPPEIPLDGQYENGGACYQLHVMESHFADGIKAARRWAPRYIYLGEIRCSHSASELLQISTGGPMTMATIHGSDPVNALTNLTKFASGAIGEELTREMLASSIKGVLYQKISNGVPEISYLSCRHSDSFGIRSKIQRGAFSQIVEHVDTQVRTRARNRGELE